MQLRVPLQGGGAAARLCVSAGQHVRTGQRIGMGQTDVPVHVAAPCDGEILGVAHAWTRRDGRVDAVLLRPQRPPTDAPPPTAAESDPIARLGVAGDWRDGEGTHLALAAAAARSAGVRDLIVRCFADEPGDTDGHEFYDGPASGASPSPHQRVCRAARWLAETVRAQRVWLAVPRDATPRLFRAWRTAADASRHNDAPRDSKTAMRVARVDADYPAGHPVLLARAIAGVETPAGRSTRDAGVWVMSAATLLGLDDFLASGHARTSVSLTVGLNDRVVQRLSVPIGTPMRELARRAASTGTHVRIVAGGLATGAAVESDEAVIDAGTTALWVFDELPSREPIPCIRCGMCVDACPVGLTPIAAYEMTTASARAPGEQPLGACIACGLCTYVCPSELPLAAAIVAERDAPTDSPASADRPPPPVRPPLLDPPQWVGGATYRGILGAWFTAAALPAVMGLILFGPAAGKLLVAAVGSAIITEAAFSRARAVAIRGNLAHAGLMGLLVGLTLPADGPVAAAMIGAVAAVAFGKIALGGIGRYLWQPALVGRVIAQFLFAAQLTYAGPMARGSVLCPDKLVFGDIHSATPVESGAYQGWAATPAPAGRDAILVERPVQVLRRLADGEATPGPESPLLTALRDELPPWQDTLTGTIPGGIGETASVALVVCILYLIARGVLRWQLPCAILLAALLTAWVCPIRLDARGPYTWLPGSLRIDGWPVGWMYVAYHLTSGQLLLGAALLAGDPTASPLNGRGQWLYGLGIGALTVLMRLYGMLECEAYWAILIMNTLVPLIDRRRRPRVWGTRTEEP